MAVEQGYTVLPVSALKTQAKVVFEALKKGQTVFVANRGRVVAAFRPYTSVPTKKHRSAPSVRSHTTMRAYSSLPSACKYPACHTVWRLYRRLDLPQDRVTLSRPLPLLHPRWRRSAPMVEASAPVHPTQRFHSRRNRRRSRCPISVLMRRVSNR
jgi:antitoxin (DNA-binding transcriptional repressor) of toxin-antitoxin stability system